MINYNKKSLPIEEQIKELLNTYRLQETLVLAESTCLSTAEHPTNSLIISTTTKKCRFY
jgi:hypothetical protein